MTKACRTLTAISLMTVQAFSQQKGIPVLEKVQSRFMELVLSDSSSNTSCLLPKGFDMGVQNSDTGRLLLLKRGRRNFFILEGTHRVYIPDIHRKGRLLRIDSTVFTGDNFETMAFFRKDTVYAYGGAGRWTNRDFITCFLEERGEWELLLRSNGLENRWVPHEYEDGKDALYVMGGRSVSHTDWKTRYRDSVYRYDFGERRWETLGAIGRDFPLRRRPVPHQALVARTPYGDLFREDGVFLLVDLPSNRTAFPKKGWADTLSSLLPNGKPTVRIHLNDTLHVLSIVDTPIHHRLRLSKTDFEPFFPNAVYESADRDTHDIRWWLALALAASVGFALWAKGRMRKKQEEPSDQASMETVDGDGTETTRDRVPGDDPSGTTTSPQLNDGEWMRKDADELRRYLSPIEWELIMALAESTMAGRTLDTEEVNKAIGVSMKDPSLQKSRRSMVIGRINRVYTQCTGRKEELVVRERDGDEKRRYNYRLDAGMAGLLTECEKD